MYANNKGADQPAQFYQLSLETCYMQKIKFLSDMRARIQKFQGGGGGGGVRGRIASRGRFVTIFLLGNKWQVIIFMGRSAPPAPSVSAHIRVSNSLNSHFIYFIYFFFCCAGPGQFTKLLVISAVAKGKDSMILFKIKETAHINSGHVLF